MLKADRHQALLRLLQTRGSVSISELADHLGVSPATARRDLAELEGQSRIERTWGGVRRTADVDDPFQDALTRASASKYRIGAVAASLVPDGATVILDIGTTAHHVAAHLASRDVTVLTASLPTFEVLRAGGLATLVLLGGHWSEQYRCFTGSPVVDALRHQHADIAFLGCSGVARSGRIRDTSPSETAIKRAIREASTQLHLLADVSKFPGKGGSSPFGVGELDGIITDAPALDESLVELCRTHHTEIRNV